MPFNLSSLPQFKIRAGGDVSVAFLTRGIEDFHSAVQHVANLPYGPRVTRHDQHMMEKQVHVQKPTRGMNGMFISVTRLHLRGKSKLHVFFWYTLRSALQAKKSGCLYSAFYKEGWHTYWTLTVWPDEVHMKRFRNHGPHLKAMKIARKLADELEYINWTDDRISDWEECRKRLHTKYGRK